MKRLLYDVQVYYHGPRSAFSRTVDPIEVIFEGSTPWLWCARWMARAQLGSTGRCGYVIMRGGTKVDEVPPAKPEYASV